jgi:hypothetical protein
MEVCARELGHFDRLGEVPHRLLHPGRKLLDRVGDPLVGGISDAPDCDGRTGSSQDRDPERADKYNEGHRKFLTIGEDSVGIYGLKR